MHKNFSRPFCAIAVFAVVFTGMEGYAQVMGGGMPAESTTGSGTGGTGGQNGMTASPEFRDKSDLNGAIAPPFDLEDVLRMSRVGLQDEVIVNALRRRYHPLILTDENRKTLKSVGVSDRVIVAIEDPYGIGIENVRENMRAAEGKAPPVAQTARQAEAADPHRPMLKTRTASSSQGLSAGDGEVYVGKSSPPPDSTIAVASEPSDVVPAPNPALGAEANLDISKAPLTGIPPEPVMKVVSKPIGPGVYLRHGSDWERVDEEPVYWRHHGDNDKDIEGLVLHPQSAAQTYPGGSDFLIITTKETSAIQYELMHLKADEEKRSFKPAPAGQVYNNGRGDLVRFDPLQLGPSSWLISIRDVPPGEYGFLPPVTSQVHSTTNLATTLYTFRVK